jgi:YhcH/YjgK/YiaL family protein
MILDTLENAPRYYGLGPRFIKAFEYLANTDFDKVEKGRYEIDGKNIFAIVNEYDTIDTEGEQMESHRKYIDVQYIVKGEELIGHDYLQQQTPSKAYDEETDYMLFAEKPSFFSKLDQGNFAVFFPTDLHMPNIRVGTPIPVKKVVIKIGVSNVNN